ncbi:unnamed protein product, partial [marine sediment metagenome]
QSKHQTNLAKLVAFWPTLSQANKDSWTENLVPYLHTTPWGDTKTLSGYQCFLSVNLNRLLYGYAAMAGSPVYHSYSPPPAFTLTATDDVFRCNWDPEYDLTASTLTMNRLTPRVNSLHRLQVTGCTPAEPDINRTVMQK